MVSPPSEVQAAMKLRMAHCHGEKRPARRLELLAAIAALQSTGHLVTQLLPSYCEAVDFRAGRQAGRAICHMLHFA